MAELTEPENLNDLYRTPQGDASEGSSATQGRTSTVSNDEREFYRRKAALYRLMKWFVLPAVSLAVTVALALWIAYLQSIVGPVNKLEGKLEESNKSVDRLTDKVDDLQEEVLNNRTVPEDAQQKQ